MLFILLDYKKLKILCFTKRYIAYEGLHCLKKLSVTLARYSNDQRDIDAAMDKISLKTPPPPPPLHTV